MQPDPQVSVGKQATWRATQPTLNCDVIGNKPSLNQSAEISVFIAEGSINSPG